MNYPFHREPVDCVKWLRLASHGTWHMSSEIMEETVKGQWQEDTHSMHGLAHLL